MAGWAVCEAGQSEGDVAIQIFIIIQNQTRQRKGEKESSLAATADKSTVEIEKIVVATPKWRRASVLEQA